LLGAVKEQIRSILANRTFNYSVDLGCGFGDGAEVIRPHTRTLIGVDNDWSKLQVAEATRLYDELHLSDIRIFAILEQCDSVFLFDSIEHIPKKDGEVLLMRLQKFPFLLLTTPSKYFPHALDGHVTVWSESELKRFGFETSTFSLGVPSLIYGREIMAVKWR